MSRGIRQGDLILVARRFPHQDDKIYEVIHSYKSTKKVTVKHKSQFSDSKTIPWSDIFGVMPKNPKDY
jgi:hypothetical protein